MDPRRPNRLGLLTSMLYKNGEGVWEVVLWLGGSSKFLSKDDNRTRRGCVAGLSTLPRYHSWGIG